MVLFYSEMIIIVLHFPSILSPANLVQKIFIAMLK